LAATTNGVSDGNTSGDIDSFELVKDFIPVVQSGHGDTPSGSGDGASRPHTLFYKETVSGGAAEFTVNWTGSPAMGGVVGVDAQNLMWGYKIYDAGYEIMTEAMHSTCI